MDAVHNTLAINLLDLTACIGTARAITEMRIARHVVMSEHYERELLDAETNPRRLAANLLNRILRKVMAGTPSPTIRDVMDRLQSAFEARLQAKTSWGRNELLREYGAARLQVVEEMLEEQQGT
jgi:lipoate-protein ligase A